MEVIDIRTMIPLDVDAIMQSARKTNRVLIAYEDHEFMGFGAEIAAQVADKAFGYLDAPVRRLAGAFTYIPFAGPLERAVLPQSEDLYAAARDVLGVLTRVYPRKDRFVACQRGASMRMPRRPSGSVR